MKEQGTYELIAKTLYGLEPILAQELEALGAGDIQLQNRAVTFTGDKTLLYKANLWLRTAIRIMTPIASGKAHNEDELYRTTGQVDWQQYIQLNQTFVIHSTVYSDHFNHSLYVAQKVKDAIADQFREATGQRPSVDKQRADVTIHVHISDDEVSFLLDSSGAALYKRGYKLKIFEANLNECLAAGMILLSGWDGTTPLYDPMCGSGTLLTEAALIARNKAPGLYRSQFGFMHWPDYDAALFKQLQQQARDAEKDNPVLILGSDISSRALADARANISNARLEKAIKLKKVAFEQSSPPTEAGTIIVNPPYDERIEKDDIDLFYREMGSTLKRNYSGWEAWVLSGNLEAMKYFGLKPSRKIPLFNGSIECRFFKYELYRGSKKAAKQGLPLPEKPKKASPSPEKEKPRGIHRKR